MISEYLTVYRTAEIPAFKTRHFAVSQQYMLSFSVVRYRLVSVKIRAVAVHADKDVGPAMTTTGLPTISWTYRDPPRLAESLGDKIPLIYIWRTRWFHRLISELGMYVQT